MELCFWELCAVGVLFTEENRSKQKREKPDPFGTFQRVLREVLEDHGLSPPPPPPERSGSLNAVGFSEHLFALRSVLSAFRERSQYYIRLYVTRRSDPDHDLRSLVPKGFIAKNNQRSFRDSALNLSLFNPRLRGKTPLFQFTSFHLLSTCKL